MTVATQPVDVEFTDADLVAAAAALGMPPHVLIARLGLPGIETRTIARRRFDVAGVVLVGCLRSLPGSVAAGVFAWWWFR